MVRRGTDVLRIAIASPHYGHHILHCIISHQTPSLALFQTPHSTSHHFLPYHALNIAPAPLAAHYSTLQYHISNRTMSATLCITPLTSRIAPHYTLLTCHIMGHIMHHATDISHCTPFHVTDVPQMYSRPHSDHTILPHLCIASHCHISHHTTLHSISHAPHLTVITQFHIALP